MKSKKQNIVGLSLALALAAGCGVNAGETKDLETKSSEASIVTNENGSISRTFVESSITTNGSMVTEHRRETRTNMDSSGNILETTTSEYAQSYNVGDTGFTPLTAHVGAAGAAAEKPAPADSFLGLKFGEKFAATNAVQDADEPALLRATFVPTKPLAGFDDYYVYLTPKTHKVVKVIACAKEAVDPGMRWRRHYLVEALEQRYRTVGRLCSFRRPCYAFDVGPDRYVTACLSGASDSYETAIAAWDEAVGRVASEEYAEIRAEARKNAAEKRKGRVSEAAAAF